MARSFMSVALSAIKAAERDRVRQAKSAVREENARHKENVRQAKAFEADLKKSAIANEKDRKAHETAVKAAHAASQLAEVDRLNSQINGVFHDLENLLSATIAVDDYVDLESLRKSEDTTPFDKPELEIPLLKPEQPNFPSEPRYVEPAKPTGFFGKKRKAEEAKQQAQQQYEAAQARWKDSVASLQSKYESDIDHYGQAEMARLAALASEKARFQRELLEHNQSLDQFISDLSYGDAVAIQEYISLVLENSVYPEHFQIRHDFSFVSESAELLMKVYVPAPNDFPSIKSYKYIKASDEIRETPLSKTEFKALYCSVLYQVALRTLHEVFEADRRGLIDTIALEVGTEGSDPATGKVGFIPFVGVAASRNSFMEFDLSGLVPLATLKHLGAAISVDPTNLVAANVGGVRRS